MLHVIIYGRECGAFVYIRQQFPGRDWESTDRRCGLWSSLYH